jgi:hypothetical protein
MTTEQNKDLILRTQARVRQITGLSEQAITEMRIELAFEWLTSIGCVGGMQTQMASTKEFWRCFWLREWHRIDLLFIAYHNRCDYNTVQAIKFYRHFHSSSRYVQDAVMHAGYHQVIKHITKKERV